MNLPQLKLLLIDEEMACMASALNVYLGRMEFTSVEALFMANEQNLKLAKKSLTDYTRAMLRYHPALMNSLGLGPDKKTKRLIYNSNWFGDYQLTHYFTSKVRDSLLQHQKLIIHLVVDTEEGGAGHAMCALRNPQNGEPSIVDWVDNKRAVTSLIRLDGFRFRVHLNRINYPIDLKLEDLDPEFRSITVFVYE